MATQHIILFYRYHPLTEDIQQIETYRAALEKLCRQLDLHGRILVGASQTEGINGTLAGRSHDSVRAFTWALLKDTDAVEALSPNLVCIRRAVQDFWTESAAFFVAIAQEELRMLSPDDFKWSVAHQDDPLFPDLRVVVRKELIGTGNSKLSQISLEETAQGYLTPTEWHERLRKVDPASTVVIDCRNTKEFEIGHFAGALDPQTTTYSQFPTWVEQNQALLANKNVLMYCTGGIRCEKGAAYIRKMVPEVAQVNHLKGGIHKYLETYGGQSDSLWHGKNFVFDGRQAVSAEETQLGRDGYTGPVSKNTETSSDIVGKCVYCESPYDQFDGKCVCAVCREPVLCCLNCQTKLFEYHCHQHFNLRFCYFTELGRFSFEELQAQLKQLESLLVEISVGRKFRQKRKTIMKQCLRLQERLHHLSLSQSAQTKDKDSACRNCYQENCTGKCWGFYGLKRKEVLEASSHDKASNAAPLSPDSPRNLTKQPKRRRQQKGNKVPEIVQTGLHYPASMYRDPQTGIRVPPCITRTLWCNTKGKWCGRLMVEVVQEEFKELSNLEILQESLRHGLLRLNNKPMDAVSVARTRLKSSDVLSRVLHWHEAPVIVPERISVERVTLPLPVVQSFAMNADEAGIYVCDKPSSVPVHPAGPFFANTLTHLVEAQLGLPAQALNPVHRTDRVTSGLTLCCTDPSVAKAFHIALSEGTVRKVYVAQVKGNFPANQSELIDAKPGVTWREELKVVEVDAPVWTSDPANGIRSISSNGKASRSYFQMVTYDASSDTSIIKCFPLTGRNHQLRLHLSWMGFPIIHDVQYGGEAALTSHLDKSVAAIASMRRAINSGSMANAEARKACPVCKDVEKGIEMSFSPAQLLKRGHTIMLHALRYEVKFTKQGKEIAKANYSVGLPEWANPDLRERLDCWLEEPEESNI